MTREVSRRMSYAPEAKGGIRPDVVGLRDLNEEIVADTPDPNMRGVDMNLYHSRQAEVLGINMAEQMAEKRNRPRVIGSREPNGDQ